MTSETTGPTAFGDYEPTTTRPKNDGHQWLFRFPNGFGASVVRGPYSYGGDTGLYELGVVVWTGDHYGLTYSTPITNDVIGHLTEDQVTDTLRRIEELAPASPGSESPERFAEWENAAIGDPVTLQNPDDQVHYPCDAVNPDDGALCIRDEGHAGQHVATAAHRVRAKWVTR